MLGERRIARLAVGRENVGEQANRPGQAGRARKIQNPPDARCRARERGSRLDSTAATRSGSEPCLSGLRDASNVGSLGSPGGRDANGDRFSGPLGFPARRTGSGAEKWAHCCGCGILQSNSQFGDIVGHEIDEGIALKDQHPMVCEAGRDTIQLDVIEGRPCSRRPNAPTR